MPLPGSELPTVSLIVVNLDGRAHLEVLLESVVAQTYPIDRLEIVLVDNGSCDGSVEWLKAEHPHVKVILNSANQGFARPNNQAASVARGEFLALLNNDMKLAPDWVETMVRFLLDGPPDVACVGSRILSWDGSEVDFIGGGMGFDGMGFQPDFGLPIGSPEASKYPDELLFACGGAMVIRRDVYLDVGGFDEDYFAYLEDVDLGWRLWVMGYRVRLCPGAVVYHRHNGTSGRFGWHKKIVLLERNSIYSMIKNYEESNLLRVWPAALLLNIKRMGVRSGVDRHGFAFAPAAVPTTEPPKPEALWRIAWGYWRERGLKRTVKRVLVKLAERVITRWGSPRGPLGPQMVIPAESYASVVAMEDLMDHLPRLLEKRATVQARRRRSDRDIFRLFRTPFRPIERTPDYLAAHEKVLDSLGVRICFEASPVETECARLEC